MAARHFGPVSLSASVSIIFSCLQSLMFSFLANWETVPQRHFWCCACRGVGGLAEGGSRGKIESSIGALSSINEGAVCSMRPPHSLLSVTEHRVSPSNTGGGGVTLAGQVIVRWSVVYSIVWKSVCFLCAVCGTTVGASVTWVAMTETWYGRFLIVYLYHTLH